MAEQIIFFDLSSLLIGGLAGAALAGALLAVFAIIPLVRAKAGLEARLAAEEAALGGRFQGLAQEALKANVENFLTLAQEKLKAAQADGAHDLDKRSQAIAQMVKPVESYLAQLKGTVDQLQGSDKIIRDEVQNLRHETARLTGALKNPAAQGRWGEMVLEGLLDKANLIKGVHYETQVAIEGSDGSRQRPDYVVSLHDGFKIVIDAKAPITEFINKMNDDMTTQSRADLSQHIARAVRGHIKALGARAYWEKLDSPDFVVLFLPGEHIFSSALSADPSLIDFAMDNKVVVASPTLILSLLAVVGLSWRQAELAKNAQEISKLGGDLYKRITTFKSHLDKVGKGIEGALGAYNKAVGTMEGNLLAPARKLRELQGGKADELDAPLVIEAAPRALSLPNDMDDEEDNKQDKRYAS